MKLTGTFKIYFDVVINEVTSYAIPKEGTVAYEELKDTVGNSIFGTETLEPLTTKPSDQALFISDKLFKPLSEIMNNIEALENITIYIGSFTYKKQGISRLSYLRYHIENYLNELYILKNRSISYLNLIKKSYRKCNRKPLIHKELESLYTLVSQSLETYINVRGSHVHKSRYTDSELDKLGQLELLSSNSNGTNDKLSKIAQYLFIENYKKARKKWRSKMQNDIKEIEHLTEIYFYNLCNAIIENNKILYPSNTKWA